MAFCRCAKGGLKSHLGFWHRVYGRGDGVKPDPKTNRVAGLTSPRLSGAVGTCALATDERHRSSLFIMNPHTKCTCVFSDVSEFSTLYVLSKRSRTETAQEKYESPLLIPASYRLLIPKNI
ncbi:hypothetical protein M3J09_012464 [Ascochyta lentis]